MRLLAWGVPKLSRLSCVHLANAFGELGYRFDHRGRAVARANVECAFGDTLTPGERNEIVRASYRNFVRSMLDLFWSPVLVTEQGRGYIRIHGWDVIKERVDREKRGILFISPHAGIWEWASLACGFVAGGSIAVAEEFANPILGPIITKVRQVSGQEIIPQDKSMLRMVRAVKRGGCSAFLCDLSVHPNQAATIVRVFGMEISASILHAALADIGGALLVAMQAIPQADGSCDVYASVIEMPTGLTAREIAQRCWDHFEPWLRRDPGLWMWPYKHFRFRPRGVEKAYPFYANDSGAFEKLRKKEGVTQTAQA